jgi:hypothetical protein
MSYEYEEAMGTNGKGTTPTRPEPPPSGPVTQERIGQFWRETAAYEQGLEQQREAEAAAERAGRLERAQERAEYFEQNPGALAAAQFGACAIGSIPWGAAIGAIASPKGERGGGAKWGILASMATCPLVPLFARLGYVGTVMNFALGVAAPVVAARYRLKRKEERGETIGR